MKDNRVRRKDIRKKMVNKKDEEKEGKKENVGENGLRKRYEQE